MIREAVLERIGAQLAAWFWRDCCARDSGDGIPGVIAQQIAEISYNTFLDPNNASDPRAARKAR